MRSTASRLTPTLWALLVFFVLFPLAAAAHSSHGHVHAHHPENANASPEQQPMMASAASKNVFKTPLHFLSSNPMTGFLRNGYCEVPAADFGNHSVAAEVTEEFLDFTASRGNDLRQAGLKGGCRWCLCASRWREAFDARKGDADPIVPKVFMSATNEKALDKVSLDELKKFAAKED